MLEKMEDFFNARLEGYEEHQLSCIEAAREFYPFTAACLPQAPGSAVLDLGCGTGLELGYYYDRVPTARITGVDLARGMLETLRAKFPDRALTLIQGSYFDVPFGERVFDAAVSVESLHHFTKEEKLPLYRKLRTALKPGGWFILTDYFALSEEEERQRRQELLRLKAEQGLREDVFYHYDTPLTVAHETEALLEAGFASVEALAQWGQTFALKASGQSPERPELRTESGGAAYRIRMAGPEDEGRIRELFMEMLRTIYHTDSVEGYEPGYLDKFWAGGEDRIYVAEEKDVVAFLSVEVYREPEAYLYLDDFSVAAAHRNRGIGTALIRRAEACARELGIPAIVFHVEKTNRAAMRLYERLGYAVFRDDGSRYLMHLKFDLQSGPVSGG